MELKKITEEVNALSEQFPYFWSQFELEEGGQSLIPSHHQPSYSHSLLPHNPSHQPPSLFNQPSFDSTSHHHDNLTDILDLHNPSSDDTSITSSSPSHRPITPISRQPSLTQSDRTFTTPSSPIQPVSLMEGIQLHHIRCRYIERGKHFELSWSCPAMANYTWLVDQHDIDPRCLNRIREGTGRHGRHNPSFLSDPSVMASPFRLKAEIGIETSDGWVPLQQCCNQCSSPLVLFAAGSTRMSEQGHGRIVAQVHFTKTHGGRAATIKVGLRLKCVTVNTSRMSSSSSSSGSSSSSIQHVETSSQTIIMNAPHISSSQNVSSDHTRYEIVSNWTELPFKRHENKKRKNPFDDNTHRRESRRRAPALPEETTRRITRSITGRGTPKEKSEPPQSYPQRNSPTDQEVSEFNHYGSSFVSAHRPPVLLRGNISREDLHLYNRGHIESPVSV